MTCFWTDLLGVTQECGGADAKSDILLVVGSAKDGEGGIVQASSWSDIDGFGGVISKSSFAGIYDLAVFSPSGKSLVVTTDDFPYVAAYRYDAISGVGTKLKVTDKVPNGSVRRLIFSPGGDYLAVCLSVAPYITVYGWSDEDGFGSGYPNPGNKITSEAKSASFSPDSSLIAISLDSSPFVAVYDWSKGGGFGRRYDNPSSIPDGSSYGVAFNKSGDAVAFQIQEKFGYMAGARIYRWSAGFSNLYSTSSVSEHSKTIREVAFSPDDKSFIFINDESPKIFIHRWSVSGGVGSRYNDPPGDFSGGAHRVRFSPSCGAIFDFYSGGVVAYKWSADTGFGDKYGAPNGWAVYEVADAIFLKGHK